MKLITQTPKKALKAFLKQKPLRSEIDVFKTNLIALLDKISVIEKRPKDESEEHLKNDLRDFLRDTFYKDTNAINTKDKQDLVIYLDKSTNSEVAVIIEAKRPTNIGEMVTANNPNKKALHELILYYLNERNKVGNFQLKQLVITNINEWYIIDANYFDKYIYNNTQIQNLYKTKVNDNKNNPFFYQEIEKLVSKIEVEIPCVYFDIREYNTILRNNKKEDDRELIALFKILSPQHLLKIATPNDSNSLNEKFYKELLHIIGLEEAKENGKNIIRRKKVGRNAASLVELTVDAILTEDLLHKLPDQSIYGTTKDERVFSVSLELCIIWINRILFLKLLEGQLVNYNTPSPLERVKGEEYRFLYPEMINSFDELFKLFHKVLAVNIQHRTDAIKSKYSRVPYLNSSLFEISDLEDQTLRINSLDNEGQLELINTTILKDVKKKVDKLPTLDYLFKFLDAYDFASEGTEDVQEDNKTIINASVLGKVFEKINGYKDGSVFTPAFITMYMCKHSIRLAVVEKFNCLNQDLQDLKINKYKNLSDIYEAVGKDFDRKQANEIINSLKICDPAVGSGHFLVSALNEIIAVKSELGILMDKNGKTLRDYKAEVIDDELYVYDIETELQFYYLKPEPKSNKVKYQFGGGILNADGITNSERHRVQETLFHEKQTIIENCLFGVDINPNSVKICRLRLWIELLKNAYYKAETGFTELETLPNIDINIKCGNSLLSRFALHADLSKALKSIKYDIKAYRGFVNDYKNEKSRDVKRGLQIIINSIKNDFRTEIGNNDPKQIKLSKLSGDLYNLLNQGKLFELDNKQKKLQKENQIKLEADITKLVKEVEDIKSNVIYKNAFEWRFEFPEVLNNNGDFEGFDLIIGNPPYIRQEEIKHLKNHLESNYKIYTSSADIFIYFIELAIGISKNVGVVNYIIPNKWMKANYGFKTRNFLKHYNINQILDFGDLPVFSEVTTYPCILALSNSISPINFEAVEFKSLNFKQGIDNYIQENKVLINKELLTDESWSLSNNNSQEIIQKIKLNSVALGKFINVKINYGIKTSLNDAFIIDTATKNRIIKQDPHCERLIKPFLSGKEIKAYQNPIAVNYVIVVPKGFTIKRNLDNFDINYLAEPTPRYGNMPLDDAWEWFYKNYRPIAEHLLPYKLKAEARTDKGDYWWELRACDYYNEMEKEKIVWPETSLANQFCYVEKGTYLNKTSFFMPGRNHFLLALLNSKLIGFYLSSIVSKVRGGYFSLSKIYVEKIPIKAIGKDDERAFVNLVDKIIAQKQKGEDTKANEKLIDTMVYQLYHITAEEQKLIEEK